MLGQIVMEMTGKSFNAVFPKISWDNQTTRFFVCFVAYFILI